MFWFNDSNFSTHPQPLLQKKALDSQLDASKIIGRQVGEVPCYEPNLATMSACVTVEIPSREFPSQFRTWQAEGCVRAGKTIFSARQLLLQNGRCKVFIMMLMEPVCSFNRVTICAPQPRSAWTSFSINAEEAAEVYVDVSEAHYCSARHLAGGGAMDFCAVCGVPKNERAVTMMCSLCSWACRLCDAGMLIRPVPCWVSSGQECNKCPKCRQLRLGASNALSKIKRSNPQWEDDSPLYIITCDF